jgi:hypothetical protein
MGIGFLGVSVSFCRQLMRRRGGRIRRWIRLIFADWMIGCRIAEVRIMSLRFPCYAIRLMLVPNADAGFSNTGLRRPQETLRCL